MHLNTPSQSGTATPRQTSARLALFDLDYTLLPIDSDYEWARFLVRIGVVDGAEYERRNDEFFRQYHAGTLDIHEFLEFQLAPLGAHPPETLERWHAQFMEEVIRPQIRPRALELVRGHLERGDLCAIVTATNEFVTGPIARAFDIEHLIATGVERVGGRYTGRPSGTPSFREGKILRTREWLADLGRDFADFGESWFYSDSANDVPLLEQVTNPVATNPDERLAALAGARNWPVLRLFE
jgi:HAD superfamily hydrolase (TIGR01490 family)